MRAVVLGLVGAVLAAGGAQAGQCFTVGAGPEARPVARPDLIGKSAKLVRETENKNTGWVDVAIGTERYVVRYELAVGSVPAVMGFSKIEGDQRPKVWRKPSGRQVIGCQQGACGQIYDGPLGGLWLEGRTCS